MKKFCKIALLFLICSTANSAPLFEVKNDTGKIIMEVSDDGVRFFNPQYTPVNTEKDTLMVISATKIKAMVRKAGSGSASRDFDIADIGSIRKGTGKSVMKMSVTEGYGVGGDSAVVFYKPKNAFRTNSILQDVNLVGDGSFAAGYLNQASGKNSTAFGYYTVASGIYSTALGYNTTAVGEASTAMGFCTTASADYSTAMGFYTQAGGVSSTAMGSYTTALGNYSTAMGRNSQAGDNSTAIGDHASASALNSLSMGSNTSADWNYSTAIGYNTHARDENSTAIGHSTTALGANSTAIGINTTALGDYSTAMGVNTTAQGMYSTTMGNETTASGDYSTAMGNATTASGYYSTAMGSNTTASWRYSTAMGLATMATGEHSTAMGFGSIAQAYSSTVVGQWNKFEGTFDSWVPTDPLFVVGNGTDGPNRSNAFEVKKNGNTYIPSLYTTTTQPQLNKKTVLVDEKGKLCVATAKDDNFNSADISLLKKENSDLKAKLIEQDERIKAIEKILKENQDQGR